MTRTSLVTKALLPLAVGLAAVAGCTSTGQPESAPAPNAQNPPAANAPAASQPSGNAPVPGAPAGPPPGANFAEQQLNVGRQFSQCARQNGQPNFPDPVVANGQMGWPGAEKEQVEAAGQACNQILQQLGTIPQVTEPPSAETLEHMRQFAQCMRQQGLSDWPDPKADGTFPLLGTQYRGFARYAVDKPSQQAVDARAACVQFEVEWRIAAS